MKQLICASLSHTHYISMKWVCRKYTGGCLYVYDVFWAMYKIGSIPGYFLDKIGHHLSLCCTAVSKLGSVCYIFEPALVLLYSIFCL